MLIGVVGGLLLTVGTMGVGAHFVGFTSTAVAWIASFTPVAVVLSAVALTLLLLGRHRWPAVIAMVVVIIGVFTQAPLYRSGAVDGPSAGSVRIMQANIRLGEADLDALVRSVRSRDIDLLTVIELTGPAVTELATAGIDELLPHRCARPRAGGGGAGIYSRFPLRECAQLDGFALSNVRAVAAIPDTVSTAVYALHPLPPYPEPVWKWVHELKRLRPIFAAERHPMIVGADFNSTYDHRQYRDLIENSTPPGAAPLVDAAEYVGAGLVPTFPADSIVPPLLAIDRILTRGPVPVSFERFDVPGSDHLGVVGNLAIPEQNSN